MQLRLYDRATADRLADELPAPLSAFLTDLLRQGAGAFIENADSEVCVLAGDGAAMPVVLASVGSPMKNAYVCSPTSQYIDTALHELEVNLDEKAFLRRIGPASFAALKFMANVTGFERAAFVNNWFLSTNLHPELDEMSLQKTVDLLAERFPDRAIVFKSVNDSLTAPLLDRLLRFGFRKVFSRQVYILDPALKKYKKKRMFTSDRKLWKQNEEYVWETLSDPTAEELERIRQLYYDLYLGKYSQLNPYYKTSYISGLLSAGVLRFDVLRNRKGGIDAVQAVYRHNGSITTPFIGYDQTLPLELGLYRFMTYQLIEEAAANGLKLNMSSGASHFKKLRGGVPSLEYNLVYDLHLPYHRRLPWRVFEALSDRVAIPNVVKHGL